MDDRASLASAFAEADDDLLAGRKFYHVGPPAEC
jgi:hypothetical protein